MCVGVCECKCMLELQYFKRLVRYIHNLLSAEQSHTVVIVL